MTLQFKFNWKLSWGFITLAAFQLRNYTLLRLITFFLSPAEEDSVFDESDIHDTPTGPCNKESQTFFARLKRIGGSKMVKYQPVEMNAQRSMIFFLISCRNTISHSQFQIITFLCRVYCTACPQCCNPKLFWNLFKIVCIANFSLYLL